MSRAAVHASAWLLLAILVLPGCPWSRKPGPLTSNEHTYEGALSSDDSETHLRLTITGNTDAFWGLGEKEQVGTVYLLGTAFDTGSSEETPVGGFSVITDDDHDQDDFTFGQYDIAGFDGDVTWFSGVCREGGGCSRTGSIDIWIDDPIPGQAFDFELTVQALLETVGGGYPGGDPQLTIEVEKIY